MALANNKMHSEVDEILSLYKELRSLNPRPSKKSNDEVLLDTSSKTFELSEQLKDYSSKRKPSLPLFNHLNTQRNDSNSNPSFQSRKSLFQFERSLSSFNLSESKSIFHDELEDINGFLEVPSKKKSSTNRISKSIDEKHVYETIPTILSALMKNSTASDNHEYLEMNRLVAEEDVIEILPETHGPKNSVEIIRNSMIKNTNRTGSHLSEKQKSAPESGRNSDTNCKSSDHKLTQLSIDSGISSGLIINKLDFINLQNLDQNDQTNSSESISDISDSISFNKKDNQMCLIENDLPTITDKTDSVSLSSKKSENSVEIKSVTCEEEKMKFLRMVAKDISLKSYSVKEIIRFYLPNGTFSSQIIDISQTASSVCDRLKEHFNICQTDHWQITEIIQSESIERSLEDNENILNVFYSWKQENTVNKFVFRDNPDMYQIFVKPQMFNKEMACDFEIDDNIWVKEAKSRWRRVSCFICDSKVYFKIKPDSKDHKDLYSLVNLKIVNIYTCNDASKIKKVYKAPTNELIVFHTNNSEQKFQDCPCICLMNSQQKERWLESLKVGKYSFDQLKQNYLDFEKKGKKYSRAKSYSKGCPPSENLMFNPSSV